MTPERLQQIEHVFHDALERNESEQMDFVRQACGDDADLCAEVLSLLEAFHQVDQHETKPAMDLAAQELAAERSRPSTFPDLENYDVISPLGRGGMGEVVLAKDKRLKRKVALKLLPSYYASNEERLRRFEQEAFTASALTHPNILTVYEIGHSGDSYFIATEFVEGQTLRQRIRAGAIPIHESIEIAIQVANALQAAHVAGIVHRDIKPDNIMIRPDGFVKILDFGIAKLTETAQHDDATTIPAGGYETATGQVIGTPAYLSPEQARGLKLDGRSDLFSLGVVLYEMLFGRQPFTGPSAADVMVAMLEKDPAIPPTTNPALKHVLTKALSKPLAHRYQSAEEMAKELRQLQHTAAPDTASFATTQFDLPLPPQRRNYWLLIVLAVALLLAGLLAYRYWPTSPKAESQVQVTTSHPPVEVMQYFLEVAGAKGQTRFTNETEALTAKQDFKFHFVANQSGYLYIVAPGKNNLPETFLTAQPPKGSGVSSNVIAAGVEFKFPAGDEYWINLSNAHTSTFSVIFSPSPLNAPAFLALPAGHQLTVAEQQEWEAFRNEVGVLTPRITPGQPRVSVLRTATEIKPLLYDVTVKLK